MSNEVLLLAIGGIATIVMITIGRIVRESEQRIVSYLNSLGTMGAEHTDELRRELRLINETLRKGQGK